MSNATKVSAIIDAARSAERKVQSIAIADAADPASGLTLADDGLSYDSGLEAILSFSATRAASAGVTAGTPVTIAQLVAPLVPAGICYSQGTVETSPGNFIRGSYKVDAAGLVTFTPDATAAAGTGFVFHPRALRVGPRAGDLTTSIA